MAKLFSDREIRAIAVFLPLAGLLIIALMLVRPAADPEAARRAEAEMEEALPADSVVMSHFDPNTASFDDLRRLGLTKHEAVSLLKYRAAGKVFRIPEDLTLCYGISDSLYRRLEPWVRIGRKYAIAPEKYRTGRILPEPLAPGPFRIDTVSARYLRAIGALSKRQAEAFIRWIREMNARMGIPEKIPQIRTADIPEMARHAARESNPLYPVPVLMDERQLAQMYVQLMPVKKEENA